MYLKKLRRTGALMAGLLLAASLYEPSRPRTPPRLRRLPGTCPADTQALVPVSSTALAGGGYSYRYLVDGLPQTQTVAPASFTPATASDVALREYDYPPRPAAGTAEFAQWIDHARTYRGSKASKMCRSNRLISRPNRATSRPSPWSTNAGSGNWSGMVASQTASIEGNRPFKFVQGQWVQTGYQNCGCTEPTDESTWVGIGGDQPNSTGQDGLIQDGTDMYGTDQPNSWWEYLYPCPTGTQECGVSEQAALNVKVGDTIFAETYWDGTAAHFLVNDNGIAVLSETVTLPTSAWDGRNAEWINERPSYGGSNPYLPLTNYGVQHWANGFACPSTATGSLCYTIAQFNSTYTEMINNSTLTAETCSSTNVLAYPSAVSGGSFSSNWCRAK